MDAVAGHELIEREPPLAAPDAALDGVRSGRGGRLVLVTGEPGAGKTALVRAFARRAAPDVDVLVGWCDNLRTARPFGPLHDVAARHHPTLDALLERGAERGVVLREAFGMLHGPRPTILVLEDVHWADEATLDLISYLGRRVATVPALLVVTYRPEEVRGPHPLAVVLGDLATVRPLRLPVEPLSVAGVAALSEGTGIEPEALHRRTGGNAFFVTECLSASVEDVPATVREAVHARRSRLSPAAQLALDIASIVPGSVEAWLMEALQASVEGVDECVDAMCWCRPPPA